MSNLPFIVLFAMFVLFFLSFYVIKILDCSEKFKKFSKQVQSFSVWGSLVLVIFSCFFYMLGSEYIRQGVFLCFVLFAIVYSQWVFNVLAFISLLLCFVLPNFGNDYLIAKDWSGDIVSVENISSKNFVLVSPFMTYDICSGEYSQLYEFGPIKDLENKRVSLKCYIDLRVNHLFASSFYRVVPDDKLVFLKESLNFAVKEVVCKYNVNRFINEPEDFEILVYDAFVRIVEKQLKVLGMKNSESKLALKVLEIQVSNFCIEFL